MNSRDSIVDEVRRVRQEYAEKFKFDLDAMCADLQRKQKSSGSVVVSLPKRPAQTVTVRASRLDS